MFQMPLPCPYILPDDGRGNMPHSAKIATCCYCGTRAALTLRGRVRHELACSNCGAPLHEMKMLKAPEPERPARQRYYSDARPKARPQRQKKRKKSLSQRFMSEVWDVAEDLFDDIFD